MAANDIAFYKSFLKIEMKKFVQGCVLSNFYDFGRHSKRLRQLIPNMYFAKSAPHRALEAL